jgi:hypothetical protein
MDGGIDGGGFLDWVNWKHESGEEQRQTRRCPDKCYNCFLVQGFFSLAVQHGGGHWQEKAGLSSNKHHEDSSLSLGRDFLYAYIAPGALA